MAYDAHGDLWLAVIAQSTIVHLALGAVTTVATAADGLDWASSLAFGQSGGELQTLYAVNFAIGPPGGPGPSLFTLGTQAFRDSPCRRPARPGQAASSPATCIVIPTAGSCRTSACCVNSCSRDMREARG